MSPTALNDSAVHAMVGTGPAGSATARSRLQLDRALALQGAAPAAYVDLETFLEGAEGSSEARSRVADILRTFGAVQAKVIHAAPDGTHQLDIGGAKVTLKLNALRAPGDTVVIALQGRDEAAAGDSGGVVLSPAARLLASLLESGTLPGASRNTAQSADRAQAQDAQPVNLRPVTTTPGDAGSLATGLQQALSQSGLFYESHLAGWVQGRRGLNDIRREPQALLSAARGEGETDELPDGMGKLVSSQLDVLEQHAVRWNGNVWPGQVASIRIREPQEDDTPADSGESGANDSGDGGSARHWSARIAMELPSLGAVDARVSYADGRVSVQLEGGSATGSLLQGHRAELAAALAARGLNPGEIRVTQADATGSAAVERA